MKRVMWILLLLAVTGCSDLAIIRGPNRNTDKIRIEIDYCDKKPQQWILDSFIAKVNWLAPEITITCDIDDHADGHGSWNDAEVLLYELAHRNQTDDIDDNDRAFYCIWADGKMHGNDDTAGYSWSKRSFAVFPRAYSDSDPTLVAVMLHEFLHCCGLVDKYLEMQHHHNDGDSHHCEDWNCVMFSAASNPWTCQDCVDDLEAGEER